MQRIAIIVGSTRPGRRSPDIAKWAERIATPMGRAEFEVIDLADHALPLLDEPVPAAMGEYTHEHTRRWSETIAAFDGYIFVIPEYNHSIPAVLKNALDYLFEEWADKGAGVVSYGIQGGARAAEQLRLVLAELKIAVVRAQVPLAIHDDYVFNDLASPEALTPRPHQESALRRLVEEVVDWSEALQPLRTGGRHAQ